MQGKRKWPSMLIFKRLKVFFYFALKMHQTWNFTRVTYSCSRVELITKKNNWLNLRPPRVNPGSQGGFSGFFLTLLPKPVLYVTLLHPVNISKLVYFLRKVKMWLCAYFLHPQQFHKYNKYKYKLEYLARNCGLATILKILMGKHGFYNGENL